MEECGGDKKVRFSKEHQRLRILLVFVIKECIIQIFNKKTMPIKYSRLTSVWDGHYSLNIMISFWRFSIGSLWGRSFFIKSMLAVVGRPRDAAWMNASLQENMRNFFPGFLKIVENFLTLELPSYQGFSIWFCNQATLLTQEKLKTCLFLIVLSGD